MSPYAHQHNRVFALAAVLAGLAASVLITPGRFATVLLVGAFLGGFGTLLVRAVDEGEGRGPTSAAGMACAFANALTGAAVAVIVTMLVTLFGGFGFLVAGTLAVAHRLGRALNPVREVPSAPDPRPGGYRSWTMSDLVTAWTASSRMLEASPSPEERVRLAAIRSLYLDEFQRRDPHGVRRWLELGDALHSEPTLFFED